MLQREGEQMATSPGEKKKRRQRRRKRKMERMLRKKARKKRQVKTSRLRKLQRKRSPKRRQKKNLWNWPRRRRIHGTTSAALQISAMQSLRRISPVSLCPRRRKDLMRSGTSGRRRRSAQLTWRWFFLIIERMTCVTSPCSPPSPTVTVVTVTQPKCGKKKCKKSSSSFISARIWLYFDCGSATFIFFFLRFTEKLLILAEVGQRQSQKYKWNPLVFPALALRYFF